MCKMIVFLANDEKLKRCRFSLAFIVTNWNVKLIPFYMKGLARYILFVYAKCFRDQEEG
jgi:hypothetical protein